MPSGKDSHAALPGYPVFRKHEGLQTGWREGRPAARETLGERAPMFSQRDDPAAEYKEIKHEAKVEFRQVKESATKVYERNLELAREQFEKEVEKTRERFESAKQLARESFDKAIAGAREEYEFAVDIAKDQYKEWKRETKVFEKERKKSGA